MRSRLPEGPPPGLRPADARLRHRGGRARPPVGRHSWSSRRPRRRSVARWSPGADFAVQDEPRGTADAVRAALDVLPAGVSEIVVLSGDVPLVTALHVSTLLDLRRDGAGRGRAGHGRCARSRAASAGWSAMPMDGSRRSSRSATRRTSSWTSRRSTSGCMPSMSPGCDSACRTSRHRRSTGELYLPLLVAFARADRRPVATLELPDDGTLSGINDRAQLSDAELAMRLRINDGFMRAGVTMADPASAYIDATVQLAEDVTLEAGVILRGATRVGRDTVIRAGLAPGRLGGGRALHHLGERPGVGHGRGRRAHRAVLASPTGRPCRAPAPRSATSRRSRRRRSARARSSTTSATSAMPRSARA